MHKEHESKAFTAREKIIVALDVETAAAARELIEELRGEVGAFKIGLQLFASAGASFVREVVEAGNKVFLDLKFHDIPNTVAKASIEAARLGIWMLNVHASGGAQMMRTTAESVREVCDKENLSMPKIIGVTVLTSSNQETLSAVGVTIKIEEQVANLSKLTAQCGLDGVVASAHEIKIIRENVENEDFLIVTPGIRPGFATNNDQQRVMTPAEAIRQKADFLVIGRPITQAQNRSAAVKKIIEEIETI